MTLQLLGELAIRTGDRPTAPKFLEQSGTLAQKYNFYRSLGQSMIDLAGLYREEGDLKAAEMSASAGADASRRVGDPYWMPGNSSYELLGYIGFNRASGEVVFFDGTYNGMKFNWDTPTVPPGGSGYADDTGRALAAQTYDATFRIACVACHDNKKPRIITPYIKQARVGYRDATLAKAFSLGDLLPSLPRGARAPYRVFGSSYTAVHTQVLSQSRMVADPTGNCAECHGLTNSGAGRFASDAVGKLGTLSGDAGIENSYRTEWALRTGTGKILPWMVPDSGNDISSIPPVLSDSDWATLKAAIDNAPVDSLPVYTSAPAPESVIADSTRIADPSAPTNFNLAVADNRDGTSEPMTKEVHLTWNYLNGLGGVPERDDVRFNVAVLEKDIPQVEEPQA